FDRATRSFKPLDPAASYTYASYYYARDPDIINTVPASAVTVLKDKDGQALDGVEVVVRYLASLPNKTTAPRAGRLKLRKPLHVARFGSEEIQPWRGVQPASASAGAGAAALPAPAPQTAVSQGRP